MTTITVFLSEDEIDNEISFFAFEHKTGTRWHMYDKYTVISIDAYAEGSLTEKLGRFIEYFNLSGGCDFKEDNKVRRMCDMINPVLLESFVLN